jgi:hypothetical protein
VSTRPRHTDTMVLSSCHLRAGLPTAAAGVSFPVPAAGKEHASEAGRMAPPSVRRRGRGAGGVDHVIPGENSPARPPWTPRSQPCPGLAARAIVAGLPRVLALGNPIRPGLCRTGCHRSQPPTNRPGAASPPAPASAQSVLVHTSPRSVSPSDRHRRSDAPPTSVCRS